MSWQGHDPMGNSSQAGNAESQTQATTEYTLQGVMRFLQMEWHNHERARNAWDIERAEMKAKIAKQEGDSRSAKRLNEQLDRQIRMLEKALKQERARAKALAAGEKGSEEDKKLQMGEKAVNSSKRSSLSYSADPAVRGLDEDNGADRRDKSRHYLTKCVEEITYLLKHPSHPPPPPQVNMPSLANPAAFASQQDPSMGLEEGYPPQRHKSDQQQQNIASQYQAPMPDHQFNSTRTAYHRASASYGEHSGMQMLRNAPSIQNSSHGEQTSVAAPSLNERNMSHIEAENAPPSHTSDETSEKGTSFAEEPRDTLVPRRRDAGFQRLSTGRDSEGWNFDETVPIVNSISEQTQEQQQQPQPQQQHDSQPQQQQHQTRRRPDVDLFPSAKSIPAPSPPRGAPPLHGRKNSGNKSTMRRRASGSESSEGTTTQSTAADSTEFGGRYALRGHLDVIRSVIFTGGGSPSEPEICTAGDDGLIKRWIIPTNYGSYHNASSGGGSSSSSNNNSSNIHLNSSSSQNSVGNDLDIQSYFTHRGHEGVVTSLAASPASTSFATGGRALGDGWIFSGGQDATVRVWERGRVDSKATLDGHVEAVWTVCVLPSSASTALGQECSSYGGPDRILLASGSADGTVKLWSVTTPPQLASPQTGSRRGVGGSRRQSITSGSNFPSSPQPNMATSTPFHYMLVHNIYRPGNVAPTCIYPLSPLGENFVVSYNDSAVLIFDARTGEEVIGMASTETYDGTRATGVNAVVAMSGGGGAEGSAASEAGRLLPDDDGGVHGATGSTDEGGVEGVVISGHEDRYIRFFDANSGQCTYSMLAHPSAISSLSLSKDGREAVSAGHDASIRFWSLDKRICTQEISSHRIMRGEGVCSVVWSQDGRLVVSGGGDGVVRVFAR